MNDKHTPGPWDFDREVKWTNGPHSSHDPETLTGNFDVYVDGGDTIIANVNGQIDAGESNAKLIADAPRLQDENRKLKEDNSQLIGALENISLHYHADTCGSMLVSGYECNCHVSVAKRVITDIRGERNG